MRILLLILTITYTVSGTSSTASAVNIYSLSQCDKLIYFASSRASDLRPAFDPFLLGNAQSVLDLKFLDRLIGRPFRARKLTPESWVTVFHGSTSGLNMLRRNQSEVVWVYAATTALGERTLTKVPGKNIGASRSGGVIVQPPKSVHDYHITLQLKYLEADYGEPDQGRLPQDFIMKILPGGLKDAIIVRGKEPSTAIEKHPDPNTPWVSLPDWYLAKAKDYYWREHGLKLDLDQTSGMLLPIEQQ